MYDMNVPKKKKTVKDRIVRIIYVIAAIPAVVMGMGAAFMMHNVFASVVSFAFGVSLAAAVLLKMAKERTGEMLFNVKAVIYALLLIAAVFCVIMTFVMPAKNTMAIVLPILLIVPDAVISVYELVKVAPFLR